MSEINTIWESDNGKKMRYSIKDLMEGSKIEIFGEPASGEWNFPKMKTYEPVPKKQYEAEIFLSDDRIGKGVDFYYLRVTQANGQMAWSSPVWLS